MGHEQNKRIAGFRGWGWRALSHVTSGIAVRIPPTAGRNISQQVRPPMVFSVSFVTAIRGLERRYLQVQSDRPFFNSKSSFLQGQFWIPCISHFQSKIGHFRGKPTKRRAHRHTTLRIDPLKCAHKQIGEHFSPILRCFEPENAEFAPDFCGFDGIFSKVT